MNVFEQKNAELVTEFEREHLPWKTAQMCTGGFCMSSPHGVTFQEALDIVESLPEDQQEDLINIIRRRHIERRRDLLAESIKEARAEYARGEVKPGTVDDLMKELME